MKIVISSFTYYPNLDGVQKVTQYQAEGLASLGHDVSVLTIGSDNKKNDEVYNGVRILRENVKSKHGVYFGNTKQFHLKLLELTKDADVYIAIGSLNLVSKVLSQIGCKKILYLHGMPPHKLSLSFFQYGLLSGFRMIIKSFRSKHEMKKHWKHIQKFDLVTHLFEFDNTHNYFLEHGFSNNLILENAADDVFFSKKKSSIGSTSSNKNFLVVANYNERKNQIYALEAFYLANVNEISLTFIGSEKNTYYNKLVKRKKILDSKFGKRDVRFLYEIPRSQMMDYYKNSLCVILSSYSEYYPVVLVEAMACGLPFISTNVGIVNKLPGGVVIMNTDEMAYWIRLFSKDSDMVKKYGEIGRKYAQENLTIKNQVNKLNSSIENLFK